MGTGPSRKGTHWQRLPPIALIFLASNRRAARQDEQRKEEPTKTQGALTCGTKGWQRRSHPRARLR